MITANTFFNRVRGDNIRDNIRDDIRGDIRGDIIRGNTRSIQQSIRRREESIATRRGVILIWQQENKAIFDIFQL